MRRGATTQYSLRNTYDGELYQGMRHGFGVFHYANGARYEGEWKFNVKSGKVYSHLMSLLFLVIIIMQMCSGVESHDPLNK